MIKPTFFSLLIGLFIFTLHGCTAPNTHQAAAPVSSDSLVSVTPFKRDALSAYASAYHAMRQEHSGEIQLIGIQGKWIDNNLWGEWEYSFAADQKQWIYNDQGLRLQHDLSAQDIVSTAAPTTIDRLVSELSAYLETSPNPAGLKMSLAAVLWTPASGWVYNVPLESNLQ